jgi:hypothetical protein
MLVFLAFWQNNHARQEALHRHIPELAFITDKTRPPELEIPEITVCLKLLHLLYHSLTWSQHQSMLASQYGTHAVA